MARLPKRYEDYILNRIREVWGWSKQKGKVRARCQVQPGYRRCEQCDEVVPEKEHQVDHIEPFHPVAGPRLRPDNENLDYNAYYDSMFVDQDSGLQGLCTDCHKKKSKAEAKLRAYFKRKGKGQ